MIRSLLLGLLAMLLALLYAYQLDAADKPRVVDEFQFADIHQADRYHQLLGELRCLVCQNQSLAESQAPLAKDLRAEIYRRVIRGYKNDQILQFLTDRYGEFILYKPKFSVKTAALWLFPLAALLLGFLIVFKRVKA